MLRKETVSAELINVLKQLMRVESLKDFRLAGGSALALQIGHHESVDIDLFTSGYFPIDKICDELETRFELSDRIRIGGGIMILTRIHGIKIDIINDKTKFIRDPVIEEGIRMAHMDDIAAMKIKTTCDPFSGRKTLKDLADIATLLDRYSIRQMLEFVKEKYPTVAPYTENLIIQLNKDFDLAGRRSKMPKMFNGLTWEKTQEKIQAGLKAFFDELLKESEQRLKAKK